MVEKEPSKTSVPDSVVKTGLGLEDDDVWGEAAADVSDWV